MERNGYEFFINRANTHSRRM